MKKLFKKSIACLIAVLMVISALPFSPLSSPIEANAAEVKTNIDVWAASRATANTASGDRYSYKDSITEKTISGIQWGSLTHNSTYLTVSNTALSFAEINNSGEITGNDNITDLGISGNKWSFSAKFAYTGSATKTTVFGLASTTKRNYTQKNTGGSPEISNGYVADLVDIRANGDVYLNDTWTSTVSGISSDDLASSSATSPKTLTVTYDNGNLTIDIDGTQKISERVNTDLFSAGVGNYIAGPNVQVFAGAKEGIYPHYQVTNNGDYLYNMNLYSLSGAKYEETGSTIPAEVQLKNAMKAFEEKMDGSVYTNMDAAYSAYLKASKAYDAAYYGGNTAVDVTTPATNLNNKVSQMVKKNLTAYTASNPTPTFNNDSGSVSDTTYANLLYTGTNPGTVAHLDQDYIQVEFSYNDTVMMYDGVTQPKTRVMYGYKVYGNVNAFNQTKRAAYQVYPAAGNGNSSDFGGLYLTGLWKGKTSNWNYIGAYNTNTSNIGHNSSTSKKGYELEKFAAAWSEFVSYSNVLAFDTNVTWNNGEYFKDYSSVYWRSYTRGNKTKDTYHQPNKKLYVINYKPLRDAIVADSNKSARKNVASYKEGGLSTYLTGCLLAANLNPNSYSYSTDLADQVSQCATDISTAVTKFTASPSADTTTNYPALRNAFDYSGALTGFNNVTYTVREAYNGGVNNGFTQSSYDNFKAKYEEAQAVMASVYTSGYDNGSGAAKAASELETAFNALVHEHSFTGAYVKQNDDTHKQKCAFYDKCNGLSDATAHTWSEEEEVPATCTTTGTYAGKTCTECGATVGYGVIPAKGHDFTVYEYLNADSHTVKCSRDCGEEGSTYTERHDMNGSNTCTKCGYIAKVTITFVDKDGKSTSTDYAIGADIVIPELPNPNPVYTPNGDGATHTKVTYAWDNEPQTTAQTEATYTVVQTTDNDADCNFGDTATRRDVIIEGKTYDIFTCTLCHGEKQVRVADKTALNEAILQLQNDLDLPEAGYKYDAALVEKARKLINEANALGRYADQSVVNAKAEAIATAKTELNAKENLAKYTITVQVVNSDDENDEVVKGLGGTYKDIPYGETFTHIVNIPIINDDSSLSGLPKYAVYKWMVGDVKLNTADTSISGVVKGNATYICYVLNFKASTDVGGVPTTTRVRYLDKSGHTIDFDRATIGQPYTRKDTSKAPVIPYYTCTGWEPVFGDESNVGTRELVYKPIYTYKDSLANKCEIVGLNDVKVNGEESYQAIYDERIELSGADMFAYADENGSIIARINANYIYAPHIYGVSKTIYITKVETATEKAETIITGTFTTKDDPKYNYLVVNAQFYLPEGATAVESGIVIGKQNDANVLKIGSATKVVSTSQGDNHEYSVQMSYTKGKTGTLYSRSYLIYIDANGATQTVYSDAVTECIID